VTGDDPPPPTGGPRVVLNAVERAVAAYGPEFAGLRQDLSIVEAQRRDY